MGKKPVLGMVSALCVGLALTGCRDANTRSDGPALTKGATYKAPPAFGQAAANTGQQTQGWNTQPTTAAKPGSTTGGAASVLPASATPSGRMGASGVQTASGTNAAPQQPSQPALPVAASTDAAGPNAARAVDLPSASEDRKYPITGAPSGRVLPPTPPLGGTRELPPAGQGITQIPNKVEEEAPVPVLPPPPLPSTIPSRTLPDDPPPSPTAPVSADPPVAPATPPLPPLPPVPGPNG